MKTIGKIFTAVKDTVIKAVNFVKDNLFYFLFA